MFEHITAHKHTKGNRKALSASKRCGCIQCLEIYDPSEISQWHGDDIEGVEPTACCAHCNSDRLLPEAAGYSLTRELLAKMHNYWFEPTREYTAINMLDEAAIYEINERFLLPKGFRLEEGETTDPYTDYLIYEVDVTAPVDRPKPSFPQTTAAHHSNDRP